MDDYWHSPRSDYESRRRAFLEFSASAESGGGRGGVFSQISRLELGTGAVDEDSITSALDYVDERNDCADFTVSGLLRIAYQYADSPLLSADLKARIRHTLLGFKYWIDEPGKELMCFWSENHQIMFHSDEYLAGQLYKNETFTNASESGAWHVEKARKKVLNWIDAKAKVGFTEWDSNCYYDEDMTPLLNLADFSEDEEIATRAAMILDVMFFDIAVDSFRGTYGTSHGRTYPSQVTSGRREATSGVQKIAWGMGNFNNANNMTAVCLATSRRYRVPHVIERIAQDMPEEIENRERQSLHLEDVGRLGLDFADPETAMLAWGAGHNHASCIEDTLHLADVWNSHRFSVVMRPYAEAVRDTYRELDARGIDHDGDLGRQTLARVDKYTYRTPDYQLSAAQDYRKGKPGFQQHIWQATLGPDAVVFALHRGNDDDQVFKYWVGRFPRVAQHKNVLVALFDIPETPPPGPKTVFPPDASGNAMPSPGPAEEDLLPYTVAVFRRDAFDQVLEMDGWVFGRKNEGYVGIRPNNGYRWQAEHILQGEGLVSDGRQNTWICQMGRARVDGAFDAWCRDIAGSELSIEGLNVNYHAPGLGEVSFGWDVPLHVDGSEVSITGYPRFENPYCRVDHGEGNYKIAFGGAALELDFNTGLRIRTPDVTA